MIRTNEIDGEGQPLELDVAVPVAAPSTGDGRVIADELPAGRYVSVLHMGPYRHETENDLTGTRLELLDWVRLRELTISRPSGDGHLVAAGVDQFILGPGSEPDFSKWETEIAYLVIDG